MQQIFVKNRWMVLLFAVICQCISTFPSAWGVFQPYIVNEFGYTPEAATFAMPLCVVSFGVFSILGGRLQDKVSPKFASLIGITMIGIGFFNAFWIPVGNPLFMYIGFSMLFGGGCGFLITSTFSCSMKWFPDKKGFAQGFTTSMSGVYLILLTYVGEFLLATFGVRKTFLFIGIVSLILGYLVCSLLVDPTEEYILSKNQPQSDSETTKEAVVDFTPAQMLRTKQYYLLIFTIMLIMPSMMLLNPQLISICMERGLSKDTALFALALSSGATAAGRLIIPWLSDFFGRKKTMLLMWLFVLGMSVAFMVTSGFSIVIIYAALTFFYSGGFAIIGPITSDLFGFKNAGANYGLVNISNSIGSLVGPILLSALAPILGINAASYIGIACTVLAFIALFAIDTNTAAIKQKEVITEKTPVTGA